MSDTWLDETQLAECVRKLFVEPHVSRAIEVEPVVWVGTAIAQAGHRERVVRWIERSDLGGFRIVEPHEA